MSPCLTIKKTSKSKNDLQTHGSTVHRNSAHPRPKAASTQWQTKLTNFKKLVNSCLHMLNSWQFTTHGNLQYGWLKCNGNHVVQWNRRREEKRRNRKRFWEIETFAQNPVNLLAPPFFFVCFSIFVGYRMMKLPTKPDNIIVNFFNKLKAASLSSWLVSPLSEVSRK